MPRYIHIHNLDIPVTHRIKIKYCDSYLCRLRGLTFRRPLTPDEGLLLVQQHDSRLEASIHMLGVNFDLAVIWINSSLTVVDKIIAKRWRPAYAPQEAARYTLEIHPDHFKQFEIGNKVEIHDV
ncbi:MAG: DUF192 domain-containing protein [Anaerolineales bacterium]|nr:DUF192 domain-containing protein [Anaerolineales bacterium]